MALVTAIESEIFGSCVKEIDVSAAMGYRVIWLCCGWVFEIYFGVKSGSISAVDVGDGARYWRAF